ncbi:uroporphyrinogen-III synthase [Staphylococcus simiae]|uniref:Uroporphyrinogen-III synthase n=1 Tax=Staphylococcus simiae CCM 7213 = CCUG 51256 TaxID=911238 RepID=G5JLZ4_9STAP|nr:uroporphyrinogen-III synthase [Staphylococcus simiae]EHJ06791.1 uroporphyrinogen III synthase [Staphylococcus simiae CCM 7213 = CCUG 51256]PNZ12163.1 uroporphyrinogen-III synthase [Staphylococcus simiae]SNV74110.1 uroporphyrinogen III synthase [Staphylococcus simiae]
MKPVVVMTQTSEVQSELVSIIHKPFIDIEPLSFNTHLLEYNFDWLIFSSKNAVKFFFKYLDSVKVKHIAAIGEKTARYCHDLGIIVDFVPQDYSQEGFIARFQQDNQLILIPSSAQARPLLQQELSKHNRVVKIDLYTPVPNVTNITDVKEMVSQQSVDAIAFLSSSAVRYYFDQQPTPHFNQYFAIGQQTAHTLKQYNQSVKVARTQTVEALIDKILESREL